MTPDSSAQISVKKEKYNPGEIVALTGKLSPSSTIIILVLDPDEEEVIEEEIITRSDGSFTWGFTLSKDAKVGVWSVEVITRDDILDVKFEVQDVAGPTESFDFTISTVPSSVKIRAGQTATSTVKVNLQSGSPQSLSLSCSVEPSNQVDCKIFRQSITPDGSTVITVSTADTTPLGQYKVIVTAVGGGISHSTDFMVDVGPPTTGNKPPVAIINAPGPHTVSRTISFSAAQSYDDD
jgi:hypothetical protein